MQQHQFRVYPASGPSFVITVTGQSLGECQNNARAQYSGSNVVWVQQLFS